MSYTLLFSLLFIGGMFSVLSLGLSHLLYPRKIASLFLYLALGSVLLVPVSITLIQYKIIWSFIN